ncbi:hypothetical protein FF100_05590 [Methylobacterium terricola]|uniref:Uncharacterized protein n=1 Tax=Methylobacterium terricola TaxID=2583531 RepID=A0A5C4LNR2_9HYPH|nr:hypothetical protein FF100_05590 [Methylobacterium terricola]
MTGRGSDVGQHVDLEHDLQGEQDRDQREQQGEHGLAAGLKQRQQADLPLGARLGADRTAPRPPRRRGGRGGRRGHRVGGRGGQGGGIRARLLGGLKLEDRAIAADRHHDADRQAAALAGIDLVEDAPEAAGLDTHARIVARIEAVRPAQGLRGDRVRLDGLAAPGQFLLDDVAQEGGELRRAPERGCAQAAVEAAPYGLDRDGLRAGLRAHLTSLGPSMPRIPYKLRSERLLHTMCVWCHASLPLRIRK